MLTLLRILKPFYATDLHGSTAASKTREEEFVSNDFYGKFWFIRVKPRKSVAALDCAQHRRSHVLDNVIGELAGADLGCARHQALEIVRNRLLLDRSLKPAFNQIRSFVPSQVAEHHCAREHN